MQAAITRRVRTVTCSLLPACGESRRWSPLRPRGEGENSRLYICIYSRQPYMAHTQHTHTGCQNQQRRTTDGDHTTATVDWKMDRLPYAMYIRCEIVFVAFIPRAKAWQPSRSERFQPHYPTKGILSCRATYIVNKHTAHFCAGTKQNTPYGDRQHLRQAGVRRGLPPGYERRAISEDSGQGAQRQLPLP